MCGGHNLHLLFTGVISSLQEQASKAEHVPTVFGGHIWWTDLVHMSGGHNLLLLFRSHQQFAGASK